MTAFSSMVWFGPCATTVYNLALFSPLPTPLPSSASLSPRHPHPPPFASHSPPPPRAPSCPRRPHSRPLPLPHLRPRNLTRRRGQRWPQQVHHSHLLPPLLPHRRHRRHLPEDRSKTVRTRSFGMLETTSLSRHANVFEAVPIVFFFCKKNGPNSPRQSRNRRRRRPPFP